MTDHTNHRVFLTNGTAFSDEVLCSLTRGVYVPSSGAALPCRPETDDPGAAVILFDLRCLRSSLLGHASRLAERVRWAETVTMFSRRA